jgi:hypothetical protein
MISIPPHAWDSVSFLLKVVIPGSDDEGIRKEMSKCHSNLIRAVTCARLAYFVDIGSMTAAIGVIRVETVVRNRNDQHAVTVDVDAA